MFPLLTQTCQRKAGRARQLDGALRIAIALNLELTSREAADGHRWGAPPKIRFALDSPLEGAGFEPSVPLENESVSLA